MESKIHKVNTWFWKIQFFSMVVYAVALWCFTFFYGARNDKTVDIANYKSYAYLVITGINTIDPENKLFTVELLGSQYMITGLLIEFIFVAFYLQCTTQLKLLEEPAMSSLLNCILRRFNLMIYMVKGSPDEAVIDAKRSNYLKSIQEYHSRILGSNSKSKISKEEHIR